jgi:hypothetical protein
MTWKKCETKQLWHQILQIPWNDWGILRTFQVRIIDFWAEIWTRNLPNMKQEHYSFDLKVRSVWMSVVSFSTLFSCVNAEKFAIFRKYFYCSWLLFTLNISRTRAHTTHVTFITLFLWPSGPIHLNKIVFRTILIISLKLTCISIQLT